MDTTQTTFPALIQYLQELEIALFSQSQANALAELDTLFPRIRQGFHYASSFEPEGGVQLFRVLWRYFVLRGQLSLGIALADQLLQQSAQLEEEQYGKLLLYTSLLHYHKGDTEAVGNWLERYFMIAPRWRSEVMDAFGFGLKGWYQQTQRQHDNGQLSIKKSVERFRAVGHDWGESMALCFLGKLERSRMRFNIATTHFEKAHKKFKQIGDPAAIALLETEQGYGAYYQNNIATAQQHFAAAIQICRQHQFHLHAALPMLGQAGVSLQHELPEQAGLLAAIAIHILHALGISLDHPDDLARKAIVNVIVDVLGSIRWQQIQQQVKMQPFHYWANYTLGVVQ